MSSDLTPALVNRCKAWIQVIETLDTYLTAAAQRYDWISEATGRISREMPQPADLGDQFAPRGSGGIKDLFASLWWDLNLPDGKCADDASTVIKTKLLVDLASLKKDLERNIEDFSGTGVTPSTTTPAGLDSKLEQTIQTFEAAVKTAEAGKQPATDPVLIRMALDKQIDASLRKHSSSGSANHVQDVAKRLDGTVVERLQSILKQYTDMAEGNGHIIANGARQVSKVFVNEPKLSEYKHWLQSSESPQTFVHKSAELDYPKENSRYAKSIRAGMLERRSRILKTYSASEYVLTPLSLIEMRHNQPVWSIDLMGAQLLDEHKAINDNQFVIRARQHGSSSGKMHNWVFRAKVVSNWRRDLSALLSGSKPQSLASFYGVNPEDEPTSRLKATTIGEKPLAPTKSVLESDSEVSDVEDDRKV